MAKPGRKVKTVIEVTPKYGISMDALSYTIEEYSDSQGWRPIKWYGTLHEAACGLFELTAKARIVEMLGAGVSKLREETAQRILKEVEKDASRIQRAVLDAYEL